MIIGKKLTCRAVELKNDDMLVDMLMVNNCAQHDFTTLKTSYYASSLNNNHSQNITSLCGAPFKLK